MEQVFKSRQHLLFRIIFIGLPGILSITLIVIVAPIIQSVEGLFLKLIWIALSCLVVYLLWRGGLSFLKTTYSIDKGKLSYRYGIIKGVIAIDQIKSIKQSSYPSAGNRPALDLTGLDIRYGEGYSLFLSPEREDEFVHRLKEQNAKIIAPHYKSFDDHTS